MRIRTALEKYPDGRILGYALDFPGCYAWGNDDAEVMLRLPHALLKYEIWIKDHCNDPWVDLNVMDFAVEEVFNVHFMDNLLRPSLSGYQVKAFFRDDWHVLTGEEIDQALLIHRWQRDELQAGLDTMSDSAIQKLGISGTCCLNAVLKHIADAEWWYLSRLDFNPAFTKYLHADIHAHLDAAQSQIMQILPRFINEERVVGKEGEIWSCRKIIRRMLWHQRDHIEKIKSIVL